MDESQFLRVLRPYDEAFAEHDPERYGTLASSPEAR
jgi:hypothetical protein